MNMRVQQAQITSRPEEPSKKDFKDEGLMSKLMSAIQMLLQELMKESKKSGNDDQGGSPDANVGGQPPTGDCGNNKSVEPGNKAANQPAPAGGGQSEPVNKAKDTAPANAPAGDAGKPADAKDTLPGNSPASEPVVKPADTQDAGKTSGMIGPAGGKYDALIEEKAKKHGVDPDFLKIIVAKESQGNPNAESSAGAVGLGQLKPETASQYAGRPVSKDELKKDVGLNLDCAAGYLAALSKMKGGKLDDVAGSYNQGENSDWRKIPESQEYVKTVMQSYENKTLPTWG